MGKRKRIKVAAPSAVLHRYARLFCSVDAGWFIRFVYSHGWGRVTPAIISEDLQKEINEDCTHEITYRDMDGGKTYEVLSVNVKHNMAI